MSRKKKKKPTNVKHIIFTSGLECVGEVLYDSELEKTFVINPIKAMAVFDGEIYQKFFSPWSLFSEQNFFELKSNQYVSSLEATEEIVDIYNEILEKLDTDRTENTEKQSKPNSTNVINLNDFRLK